MRRAPVAAYAALALFATCARGEMLRSNGVGQAPILRRPQPVWHRLLTAPAAGRRLGKSPPLRK